MGIDSLRLGIDSYDFIANLYPWVHFSIHAKMYLGVNSLRFCSESIPMGIDLL